MSTVRGVLLTLYPSKRAGALPSTLCNYKAPEMVFAPCFSLWALKDSASARSSAISKALRFPRVENMS